MREQDILKLLSMPAARSRTTGMLAKTQVNLKLILGVDGKLAVSQLVAYKLTTSAT